jgi:hypothetical protein
MATTSVGTGFFDALKPTNKLSDADDMKFKLQGGGTTYTQTATGSSPVAFTVSTEIDFTTNTTITWQNVSGSPTTNSFSEVKIETVKGTQTTTFCTLPLSTSIQVSGTDVELTSATLSPGSRGALSLMAQSSTPTNRIDITLINDNGGATTYLTSTAIDDQSYSVTGTTVDLVSHATVTFTSPTQTHTKVNGVRAMTGGGAETIVEGDFSPTTTLSYTTNATVSLKKYDLTFT